MNQKVFNHILIGLKELPAAEPLVRFAGFFARQLGAKLTFLMVITNERERRAADGTLDLVREMLRDTIVEKKVLLGPKPTQAMLHELESGDYDLLAVSKVGRNLLSTLSLRPKSEVVPQPPKYSLLVIPAARARLQKMLICT
ncbi:MAG: universal stress protein, partial [Anaerolineales bacterium]